MPINSVFGTDKDAEKQGVWQDYGDFRIRIARQGGSNTRFNVVLARLAKPHKRAIQTDTVTPEVMQAVGLGAFAEACVTGWQYKAVDALGNAQWKDGIEDEDENGQPVILEPNVQNVVATLTKYPDLFADLSKQSQSFAMYRAMVNEDDVKNS